MPLLNFDLMDHVAHPVFVLRPGSGEPDYVFWNRWAEKLSGRSRDDVLGRSARAVFQTDLGEEAYQRHCEVVRTKRNLEYDLVLDLKGKPHEVRTTLSPSFDAEGQMNAIIGTSILLSGQRYAEQTQLETLALIERTRAEMEQYLAFAAHDLRAPMRRMAALAALLQEDLPQGATEAREIAAMMEEVSQKSQSLISDVLNFSEAHNTTDNVVETFRLNALARDIFTVLDPLRDHQLTCDDALIQTDRVTLQIILRNLVDNAIKHRDKNAVRLHIALRDRDDEVAICVTDNGPGLPDGDLQFLEGRDFEYGTGFGLLGIRRLIGGRGGRLATLPRPEGGTCICFTLPSLARILG